MGKYVYEFKRFGVLSRSNGIAITDTCGNYITGKPQFVWWWPINWIVITAYVISMLPVHLWRAYKDQ